MSLLFRKPLFYLATTGFVALLLLLRVFAREAPMPPLAVAPAERPATESLAGSGIIEAADESTAIGVPSPGLVMRVHVAVGEEVAAGQALLSLDARTLEAQLPVLEAETAVAEATLARLQQQLRPRQRLFEQHLISREEWSSADGEVRVAQAQLSAAAARVRQTRDLISQLTVTAPRAGTVLQVNIRAGEYAALSPVRPPLVLGDVRTLQVRADFDEQLAGRITPGRPALGFIKGATTKAVRLRFVRIEPYVIPKQSLTGSSSERVDTRVLQVIFRVDDELSPRPYVGQQMDVYVE